CNQSSQPLTPNPYLHFPLSSAVAIALSDGMYRSGFLMYVVERAKKCLDFSSTMHIFHLLGCIVYSRRFPDRWEWWVINIVTLILTAVLGEFLCQRKELREIPLSGRGIEV